MHRQQKEGRKKERKEEGVKEESPMAKRGSYQARLEASIGAQFKQISTPTPTTTPTSRVYVHPPSVYVCDYDMYTHDRLYVLAVAMTGFQ